MKQFETPILFLIFNRPELTLKVFDEIKKVQPKRLYVAADGPRASRKREQQICDITRKLVLENITWECEVNSLLREKNLGCKVGVSSAISWFFENEECGIIIEDDCLPDQTFFSFCEEMLEKYRNNKSIMHIGGTNFLDGKVALNESYYFSRLVHVWGWATWKRAWQLYDIEMSNLNLLIDNFEFISTDPKIMNYWDNLLTKVRNNKIDTWDYQWFYSVIINRGMGITPAVNLVSNIGFGPDATHTVNKGESVANMETKMLTTIIHPFNTTVNSVADKYEMSKILLRPSIFNFLVIRLKNLLKVLLL